MQKPEEGRHLADKRAASTGSRTAQFLRLARPAREGFHARHSPAGKVRLKEFLRIARGRTA